MDGFMLLIDLRYLYILRCQLLSLALRRAEMALDLLRKPGTFNYRTGQTYSQVHVLASQESSVYPRPKSAGSVIVRRRGHLENIKLMHQTSS
jgi:hypothetical protein